MNHRHLVPCLLLSAMGGAPAGAAIVAVDLDLPLDQVSPEERNIHVGDHHRARVFYDTKQVDPKTHIVKPLHMQHLVGGQWIPVRLTRTEMPMDDAWLDLSHQPYPYHYHSVTVMMGRSTVTDFDAPTHRMTIRNQADGQVLVAAPYAIDPKPVSDARAYTLTAAPPAFVMNGMDIVLDQVDVSQDRMFKVGGVDKVRVIYDSSLIDPKTRRVPLANLQHFINGRYSPERADAQAMPVNDAWLDLKAKPYRLHFYAKVTHGVPIIIQADEASQRLSIRPQNAPNAVLISGKYRVDPRPHRGPDVDTAATSAPRS